MSVFKQQLFALVLLIAVVALGSYLSQQRQNYVRSHISDRDSNQQ